MLRRVLRRWQRGHSPATLGEDAGHDLPNGAEAVRPAAAAVLVDSHTRTFWSRGAASSETLVEAADDGPPPASVGRRVAALLAEKRAAVAPARATRHVSVGDPAFSEALFVELMREGRYERAFAQLAPECQDSWGSPGSFAARHAGGAGEAVLGVEVRTVRYLPEWTDRRRGRTHREVAELEVAYTVRGRGGPAVLPRTVHLVSVQGRWRNLCYAE